MVESEPDTDDAGSHMGYIDTEVEDILVDGDDNEEGADSDGDELDSDDMDIDYGVWTVEYGEVVDDGDVDEDEVDDVDMEEDDATAGMIPAEEDTKEEDEDDEVARPVRRFRNVLSTRLGP